LLQRLGTELVLPRFRSLEAGQVSEKGPGDLVTVVDHEVEQALEGELPLLVPGSRVAGEERAATDPSILHGLGSGTVWIVDPIDGTTNFVEGRPTFGIMVGLLREGEVVAGWIHTPVLEEMIVAVAGGGAIRNGEPFVVMETARAEGPRDMASIRYLPPELKELWSDPELRAAFTPGYGASAIDYPRLVAGEWASLFFWRTFPWDHVPGTLIVEEAGGQVARLDGTPYSPVDGNAGLLVAASEADWRRVRDKLPD
jgi:fructose-1,6-bisphosphatase/inositol monophosphatase family enzyme